MTNHPNRSKKTIAVHLRSRDCKDLALMLRLHAVYEARYMRTMTSGQLIMNAFIAIGISRAPTDNAFPSALGQINHIYCHKCRIRYTPDGSKQDAKQSI